MKQKIRLGILSVFLTIDGEVNIWGQGKWSVFVRTRGCGVGCHWCDTKYSWANRGGRELLPYELADVVQQYSNGVRKVTITGGEPLEQDHSALALFISLLVKKKFAVTVETSGTQNTMKFRKDFHLPDELGKVSFIVDYKLQSSRFSGTMDIENHFGILRRGDFVKFVIDNEDDFWEAVDVVNRLDRIPTFEAQMFFSPSHGSMNPEKLFEMMIKANLPGKAVGLNMQMHKYIFPDDTRTEEDSMGVDFTKRTIGREAYLQQMRQEKSGEE